MLPDLEQQKADGERTAYALEVIAPKFDAIERDLTEALLESNMHDVPTRDELLRTMKNLRRVRGLLETDVNNGKFAANLLRDLKRDRSTRERIRGATGW